MEKVAAGPLIIHVEDPNLLNARAVHITPEGLISQKEEAHRTIANRWPKAMDAAKSGRAVILLPSVENLSKHPSLSPEDAKATYKQLRRHELTHWMRHRKGYRGMQVKPGIGNVLRNAREELAAHVSQVKTKGLNPSQKAAFKSAIIPGTLQSVSQNYSHQGGAIKASLAPLKASVSTKLKGLLKRFR